MNETEPKQPEQLAAVLSKASGRDITAEMIAADIEDGAPVNANGTVHLVHYMAWLLKVAGSGRKEQG